MVARESEIRPSGELTLRLLKRDQEPKRVLIKDIIRDGFPRPGLPREAFRWRLRNFAHLLIPAFKVAVINRLHIVAIQGSVYLKVIRDGVEIDLGLASLRVVTDAGVAYLTGDMNAAAGGNDISLFKFHGFGTGTGAEAAADTALGTELTTEYVVNSTRPTGSQANATNTYTTVGTLSPDSGGTLAITEHGIFSASSAGTLWDRSKFAAVNLVAGSDSLQATYVATFPSGS
jgi:hypothetical protein